MALEHEVEKWDTQASNRPISVVLFQRNGPLILYFCQLGKKQSTNFLCCHIIGGVHCCSAVNDTCLKCTKTGLVLMARMRNNQQGVKVECVDGGCCGSAR